MLLLQVFLSESGFVAGIPVGDTPTRDYVGNCVEKIDSIGLAPVKRADLVEVLSSKFAPERFRGILEFGRVVLGMSKAEVEDLVQEVAFRCLEIGCKGRMLQRLVELYPFLEDAIRVRIVRNYRLDAADLPPSDDINACLLYEAPLCQDFVLPRMSFADAVTELAHRNGAGGAVAGIIMPAQGTAQAAGNRDGEGEIVEGAGDEVHPKATADDDDNDDDDLVRKRGSGVCGTGVR